MRYGVGMMGVVLVVMMCAAALAAQAPKSPYAAWRNGPPTDPSFFPIAVWCQDPRNAEAFKAIGINTYVALWDGPTEEQLAKLKQVGMKVVCDQNEVGLKHLNDPMIIAWMHGDEPDNCQSDGKGGYGAPIAPSKIVADYEKIRQRDPSRPVMLNLGQRVANDEYIGTWAVLSDYPQYMKGSDIVSFDIYPMAGTQEITGLDWLWAVGKGVSRLEQWRTDKQVVWNALESGQISEPGHAPTPEQVRSEVWMSIIHGSRGLIYFVHQFEPTFIEARVLTDPEMSAALKDLNAQITSLAPVLNSPTIGNGGQATPKDPLVPIDVMVKEYGGKTYLFAVGMRNLPTHARVTFDRLRKAGRSGTATVVGENRTVQCDGGRIEDEFAPYQVHIYEIEAK